MITAHARNRPYLHNMQETDEITLEISKQVSLSFRENGQRLSPGDCLGLQPQAERTEPSVLNTQDSCYIWEEVKCTNKLEKLSHTFVESSKMMLEQLQQDTLSSKDKAAVLNFLNQTGAVRIEMMSSSSRSQSNKGQQDHTKITDNLTNSSYGVPETQNTQTRPSNLLLGNTSLLGNKTPGVSIVNDGLHTDTDQRNQLPGQRKTNIISGCLQKFPLSNPNMKASLPDSAPRKALIQSISRSICNSYKRSRRFRLGKPRRFGMKSTMVSNDHESTDSTLIDQGDSILLEEDQSSEPEGENNEKYTQIITNETMSAVTTGSMNFTDSSPRLAGSTETVFPTKVTKIQRKSAAINKQTRVSESSVLPSTSWVEEQSMDLPPGGSSIPTNQSDAHNIFHQSKTSMKRTIKKPSMDLPPGGSSIPTNQSDAHNIFHQSKTSIEKPPGEKQLDDTCYKSTQVEASNNGPEFTNDKDVEFEPQKGKHISENYFIANQTETLDTSAMENMESYQGSHFSHPEESGVGEDVNVENSILIKEEPDLEAECTNFCVVEDGEGVSVRQLKSNQSSANVIAQTQKSNIDPHEGNIDFVNQTRNDSTDPLEGNINIIAHSQKGNIDPHEGNSDFVKQTHNESTDQLEGNINRYCHSQKGNTDWSEGDNDYIDQSSQKPSTSFQYNRNNVDSQFEHNDTETGSTSVEEDNHLYAVNQYLAQNTENPTEFGLNETGVEFPHNEGESPKKSFLCIECGKKFMHKRSLAFHMRMHNEKKIYHCKICGAQTLWLSSFRRHLKLHTGEELFNCQFCGKNFQTKTILECHLRGHTGERPFQCEICQKSFRQKNVLKTHMRIHSGERPFECPYCKKRYNSRDYLAKHVKYHTEKKSFQCAECGDIFDNKRTLTSHMWVHSVQGAYLDSKDL